MSGLISVVICPMCDLDRDLSRWCPVGYVIYLDRICSMFDLSRSWSVQCMMHLDRDLSGAWKEQCWHIPGTWYDIYTTYVTVFRILRRRSSSPCYFVSLVLAVCPAWGTGTRRQHIVHDQQGPSLRAEDRDEVSGDVRPHAASPGGGSPDGRGRRSRPRSAFGRPYRWGKGGCSRRRKGRGPCQRGGGEGVDIVANLGQIVYSHRMDLLVDLVVKALSTGRSCCQGRYTGRSCRQGGSTGRSWSQGRSTGRFCRQGRSIPDLVWSTDGSSSGRVARVAWCMQRMFP